MNFDLADIARLARQADECAVWPGDSWKALARLGGLRWCIPQAYGGEGLQGAELFERYESLAGACLTTAFFLRPRDAACRPLIDTRNESAFVANCRPTWPPASISLPSALPSLRRRDSTRRRP